MILQVLSNLVLLRFCDCVSRVEQQQPKCQHLHAKPTLYFHAPSLKSPRSTSCYPVGTPRSLHRVSLILFSLLFPISLLHLQLCQPGASRRVLCGCCACRWQLPLCLRRAGWKREQKPAGRGKDAPGAPQAVPGGTRGSALPPVAIIAQGNGSPRFFPPQAWFFPRPADGEGHNQWACAQPTVSKHVSFPP